MTTVDIAAALVEVRRWLRRGVFEFVHGAMQRAPRRTLPAFHRFLTVNIVTSCPPRTVRESSTTPVAPRNDPQSTKKKRRPWPAFSCRAIYARLVS